MSLQSAIPLTCVFLPILVFARSPILHNVPAKMSLVRNFRTVIRVLNTPNVVGVQSCIDVLRQQALALHRAEILTASIGVIGTVPSNVDRTQTALRV
jgi:hypothetical protein